jgi:acetyl-CoA acetyltransferase
MMRGGTPATAMPTTRARGVRPWRAAAASLARMSAHAPSLTPEALRAVTVPSGRTTPLSLAVLRQLGLADDDPRVNPNGGAIALGHPLGASGARLATTAVNQLHRIQGRYALCTMCIGVGQGIAVILERV